jgi:hypothetical protein
MYPDVHLLVSMIITVGEVWLPREPPNATKSRLLLLAPHEDRAPSYG